jgi:ankyrin repeat protein
LKEFVDQEAALEEQAISDLMEGDGTIDEHIEALIQLLREQPAGRRQRLASVVFPYASQLLDSAKQPWSVFETLLGWGADVNSRDDFGATAMVWLGTYDRHFSTAAIQRLLDLGADINAVDDFGRTILTWFFKSGGKEGSAEYRFLRERGARTADELRAGAGSEMNS